MKTLAFTAAGLLAVAIYSPAHAQAEFQTQQAAQQHCPNDTVVWLNTDSGIFHFQGERWYGRTEDGAYVCEKEAEQDGDRATRNGQ